MSSDMLPFSVPRSFLSLNCTTSENLSDSFLQVTEASAHTCTHTHTHTHTQYSCQFLLSDLFWNYSIFQKSYYIITCLFACFSLLFVMYSCKLHQGGRILMCMKSESEVSQSCLTLWDPLGCRLPGPSIHGIFQARILEWFAISFSRGLSRPRNQIPVSHAAGRLFTIWTTREAINVYIHLQTWCLV